jgi:hypothetical protein
MVQYRAAVVAQFNFSRDQGTASLENITINGIVLWVTHFLAFGNMNI